MGNSAAFIHLCQDAGALSFGDFTLKSGRKSPYFFNLGKFCTSGALYQLATHYVDAIEASGIEFDGLFGPAYKGIPLAAAIACIYAQRGRTNLPYSFDRKELKDHGEGGMIVGAPLQGRILMVDDVITAGTALRQSCAMIRDLGATPVAAAIAFNRQERGKGQLDTVNELAQDEGLDVVSIASFNSMLETVKDTVTPEQKQALETYRSEYGVA